MSRFFNKLSDFTYDAYRGARRAISAAMPTVRRRIGEFTNWITGNVPPQQIPQVIDEVERNIEKTISRIPKPNFELREEQSAFRNFITQYVIDGEEGWGPDNFLETARQNITSFLRSNRNNKVMLSLFCIMKKETDHSITVERPFRSYHEINLRETNVDELYDDMVERVIENLESFMAMGSGWVFHKVISLTLFVGEYTPLQATSWIPLPIGLRNKKLINIQNKDDNNCFQYCVKSVEYPKENNHPERVTKKLKEQIQELNMSGIESPVKLNDIDKFEKQNQNFSIVVIGYDEKDGLYPLRRQRKETFNGEHLVILLMITNEEGNSHYVLVKNPSALLASSLPKHGDKLFFCWSCFGHFTSEKVLRNHQEYCYTHDIVKTVVPEKNIPIYFKNYNRTQWFPFVIYGDFESYLIPIINTTQSNVKYKLY